MREMHVLAPAKINVGLRIVGRRPDGYHRLDSLMIPVSLCDKLSIRLDRQPAAAEDALPITLTCDEATLPVDETNLAYKAAALLMRETGVRTPLSIHLQKRIPSGAGLGGGSSDAAAVLKGLNALLSLGLSEAQLCRLGTRLGADVPFFIPCRPARVEGIGEILTPVAPLVQRWIVLVVPPFGVSTPWAYRQFDALPSSAPVNVTFANLPLGQWPAPDLLVNDLECAVLPEYPHIAVIKSLLIEHGAEGALMSGSGSSVFGIFPVQATAAQAAEALQPQGRVFLVEPLAGPP